MLSIASLDCGTGGDLQTNKLCMSKVPKLVIAASLYYCCNASLMQMNNNNNNHDPLLKAAKQAEGNGEFVKIDPTTAAFELLCVFILLNNHQTFWIYSFQVRFVATKSCHATAIITYCC
jgi:hypothetical protein